MLVAGCMECMTSPSMRSKGKRRLRVFSGGVQGNLSNTRSSKVAALGRTAKAKGKRAQKAGPSDADPSFPGHTFNISSQEGCDWDVEPCMFTKGPLQHFADYMCYWLKTQVTI